jgi:hypothetical protein
MSIGYLIFTIFAILLALFVGGVCSLALMLSFAESLNNRRKRRADVRARRQ